VSASSTYRWRPVCKGCGFTGEWLTTHFGASADAAVHKADDDCDGPVDVEMIYRRELVGDVPGEVRE